MKATVAQGLCLPVKVQLVLKSQTHSGVALSGWLSSKKGEAVSPHSRGIARKGSMCVCGVTRVKRCSSRARVCVHVNIHFDISFEMLGMIEKLVMFSQGGVEYLLSS